MKITVGIGTKNRPHLIERALTSTFDQDKKNFDVIVLDDGSDEPMSIPEQYQKRVKLIRNEESMGVAAGRQRIFNEASGEIVFILDDDAVFVDQSSLSKIEKTFSESEQLAVIATKIVDYCDEVQTLFVPFPTSTIKKNPGVLDKSSKVSYYLGGAHAIRKSVFLKLGGYSKELYFGEEELDFSYKAIQAGFDLLYLPEVLIHHFSESSVTTGGKAREIHCHLANRFLIAKKYLPYRYWPSYLTSWSGKYLLDSLKICRPSSYSKGLIHGLSHMRRLERNPLGEEAISYLKKNYGRLYF